MASKKYLLTNVNTYANSNSEGVATSIVINNVNKTLPSIEVSQTGTSTTDVKYLTINGKEYQVAKDKLPDAIKIHCSSFTSWDEVFDAAEFVDGESMMRLAILIAIPSALSFSLGISSASGDKTAILSEINNVRRVDLFNWSTNETGVIVKTASGWQAGSGVATSHNSKLTLDSEGIVSKIQLIDYYSHDLPSVKAAKTGTSSDFVNYITINGKEYKIPTNSEGMAIIETDSKPTSPDPQFLYRIPETIGTSLTVYKLWEYSTATGWRSLSSIELTEAQYNELTTEQLNDGTTYMVDGASAIPSSISYESFSDLPTLNGVTVKGNLTLDDVNLYSKTQVNSLLEGRSQILYVDSLPSALTVNTWYFSKHYQDGTAVEDGKRAKYIVDSSGTITYDGLTGDIDLSGYVQTSAILTSTNTSATDQQLYSAKYLNSTFGKYLPLAGGTMTGTITVKSGTSAINGGDDDGYYEITENSDNSISGGTIVLFGKNRSELQGGVRLRCYDGTNMKILDTNSNGVLTWNSTQLKSSSQGLSLKCGTTLTDQTRDTALAYADDRGFIIIPYILFTAAESPTGLKGSAFTVEIGKFSSDYCWMTAKCLNPERTYHCQKLSGTWSDWHEICDEVNTSTTVTYDATITSSNACYTTKCGKVCTMTIRGLTSSADGLITVGSISTNKPTTTEYATLATWESTGQSYCCMSIQSSGTIIVNGITANKQYYGQISWMTD